jgi:large subunit ribosomal protein L42
VNVKTVFVDLIHLNMALRVLKYESDITKALTYGGKVFRSLRQGSSSRNLGEKITVTDDGSTIVCWHPEQCFPYDCSRSLPEKQETHSTLQIQSLDEVRSVFTEKKQEFVRQELMSLTHTTKHRWFPRAIDKYAKKTPADREYL